MAAHSSVLAWRIPGMVEPGGLQSVGSLRQTQLSYFTSTFHFHALEKKMATHSSVLAWRIPGTGEPGGLLSMGSQAVTELSYDHAGLGSLKCLCPSCNKASLVAPANAGDAGLILGSGRLPGEGNGNPVQYSGLGNPMDRRTVPWTGGLQSMGLQRVRHT